MQSNFILNSFKIKHAHLFPTPYEIQVSKNDKKERVRMDIGISS